MTRINGINFNITNATGNLSLSSKRTCADNSELYITSKLNMLYKQVVLNRTFDSKRNLKKMLENTKISSIF